VQELSTTRDTLGTVTNESESRHVEILALRTERDTLQSRSETLAGEKKAIEDRLANRERELSDHLAKREGELLDAANARESELNRELASLREKLAATEKMFGQLQDDARALTDELREKSSAFQATTEILRGEKSNLENTLFELRREHERINEEAASLRAQLNKAQIEEREESALLRERINDVAAEIARLAINLEGEPSPLEEILASPDGKPGTRPNGAPRRHLSLADRIRDLQNRAR
jgi:chromosome segregation ATPase